jgi:AcrR family transcriptional regulator
MQTRVKRGRPPEVDSRKVSLVALRLFELKGFEQVSMDDVAKAAGVSRRTLFRVFPSKADLVWEGADEVLGAVRRLAATFEHGALPLNVLVDEVMSAALRPLDQPEMAKVARRRLRLIARCPELFNHRSIEEIHQIIVTLIGTNAPPGGPPPALVARALVGVAFASVLWWAEQKRAMTAVDALHASLMTLGRAHTPVPKSTKEGKWHG